MANNRPHNKKQYGRGKPTNRFQEFKPRPLNRGVHITVYDIQGSNISDALVARIESAVEEIVQRAGVPALAIDIRKG